MVNIANFDSGLFVEGQVDNYSGEHQAQHTDINGWASRPSVRVCSAGNW